METPVDETVARRKALIIAVSEYDKANHLENLPFCKNDGNEIISVLKCKGYEISDNHKLVGYVKYDVMRKAIYDFFNDSKITFNDALLLYYSGHGFYYPGREKFTPDVCLGSSETNPDDPSWQGIPYNEIERRANYCSARSIVTILDCCHSGAAILGSKGQNEGSKLITDVFDKQHSEGEGRCLLAASQQYEEAFTLVDENHSIFTHYLLKGLRGEKKSVDDNGNVTAFTLGRYVFNTISSLDPKKRPKQKPVIKAETSGDIVLAEYPDLAKAIQDPTVEEANTKRNTGTQTQTSNNADLSRNPIPIRIPETSNDRGSRDNDYNPTRQSKGVSSSTRILILVAVAIVATLSFGLNVLVCSIFQVHRYHKNYHHNFLIYLSPPWTDCNNS